MEYLESTMETLGTDIFICYKYWDFNLTLTHSLKEDKCKNAIAMFEMKDAQYHAQKYIIFNTPPKMSQNSSYTVKVWAWISNFILHLIYLLIPCTKQIDFRRSIFLMYL